VREPLRSLFLRRFLLEFLIRLHLTSLLFFFFDIVIVEPMNRICAFIIPLPPSFSMGFYTYHPLFRPRFLPPPIDSSCGLGLVWCVGTLPSLLPLFLLPPFSITAAYSDLPANNFSSVSSPSCFPLLAFFIVPLNGWPKFSSLIFLSFFPVNVSGRGKNTFLFPHSVESIAKLEFCLFGSQYLFPGN